jgi:alkanesulfonate monooxygenase SsuD/methylene tetrahydromethanopterin reductase-like flavin-dependent oxidoreductase (luciferase family)
MTSRHVQAVTRHRRASHPAVTSLAASIATAIATTDSGAPGNSTTMPRIENRAATAARPMAASGKPQIGAQVLVVIGGEQSTFAAGAQPFR